ncbi:NAD(P)H-binding protein [Streptomyces kaniharaensis]|uniref:NAD(P)H-binding protein n=1 Tax=Streptomyces kaniharaensis TaxID=212423 RepID=A0A6N7KS72_9ACTN|nr:NAD(P)H-binding protein [Streptomyces kaniharaensis]MQS14370.1 NAD(P)H-binding protein [Streptomyces kaniharaensis]
MIVVTGATGNVGRELVRQLVEAGEQVTALSRRAPEGQLPPGVRHIAADLAEPAAVRPALEGAEALFLLVAGEEPQGLLKEAKAAGVRRVVLLSSQGVGTRPDVYEHAARFEAAVTASELEWTVLRSGGLASNAYAWAEPIRVHRTAAAPFGDVGLPFVDPDDVAAVAAAVLREDGHHGATYVLTGPALTTPRERAAAIADAIGETVRFEGQTREQAHAQMAAFLPLPVVEGTLAILGTPTPDEQRTGPDVEHILGRPARPFSAWAHRNAAAFR